MNGITVFALEIAASLAVSAVILVRLQALLRRIGSQACERGDRGATEFWVAYTQLMMLIAPILLVAWFSKAGYYTYSHIYAPVEQLKSSLGLVLLGQFVGLILVGRAVWKSIVRDATAKPTAPVPASPAIATA